MGLREYQGALAKLYTDQILRECFFADPEAAGQELGLTVAETALIASQPMGQVESFAASLIRKRQREVNKLLPRTCGALRDSFPALFARHSLSPIVGDTHKHEADALAFAALLQTQAGVESWVRDLARYESAWLELGMPNSRGYLLLRMFRHSVGGSADLRRDDHSRFGLPDGRTLGIWFRRGDRRVCHWRIPLSLWWR